MMKRQKKLYQQVASRMIEAIEKDEFGPGARLPSERDLANKFDVSRPTIREAIIALEIQGWVASKHGSGVYVAETLPSNNKEPELDIGPFELIEARRMLEGEAAALATATITEADIEKLEQSVSAMSRHHDSKEGEDADGEFHILIAEATRNSAIANLVENLWAIRYNSPLCITIFDRAYKAGIEQPVDDHRVILAALKNRDPAAARSAMYAHLDNVLERVLAATEMEAIEKTRKEISEKRDNAIRRRKIAPTP